MPAVTKYQEWTSGTYNWYSSTNTDTCGEVVNELKDWVTTINGNASQSGKQLVVEKDESSSTNASYFGFVLNCPAQTTTGNIYTAFYTTTSTNVNWRAGTTWTDDGSQGGYGTIGGTSDSDTTFSWLTSVPSGAQFLTMKGVTNGEEYFVLAWFLNQSTSTNDALWIFKDQSGEWCSMVTDGGTLSGVYYDDLAATPEWKGGNTFDTEVYPTTTSLVPIKFNVSISGVSSDDPFRASIMPKSGDLYSYASTKSFGSYIVPNASVGFSGDQLICTGTTGIFVRYTPV